MRKRAGLVLLGSVTLLALGGIDSSAMPWSSVDATAAVVKSPVVTSVRPSRPGVCILWTRIGTPRSSTLQGASEPAADAGSGGGGGNLTVAIPPVVFIRAHGRRLIVTTNTGESPQSQDEFYYTARGTTRLASARLRARVLAKCTDQSQSDG
jgi:hypothetical protein